MILGNGSLRPALRIAPFRATHPMGGLSARSEEEGITNSTVEGILYLALTAAKDPPDITDLRELAPQVPPLLLLSSCFLSSLNFRLCSILLGEFDNGFGGEGWGKNEARGTGVKIS